MPKRRNSRTYKQKQQRRNRQRARTHKIQRGGSKYIVNVSNIHLKKAWVISLEPHGLRMKGFNRIANAAELPYTVVKAINGKMIDVKTLPPLGIGRLLFSTRNNPRIRMNLGTIGCYLSHRSLYEKIVAEETDPNACHLVLEDDITFPENFKDLLAKTLIDIPSDWDIIYLSKVGKIVADKITPLIMKLQKTVDGYSNWGAWGQIYRTRFLRDQLIPYLSNMTDEIDTQIGRNLDKWNAYCYMIPIAAPRRDLISDIDMND
jgi:hypothetical protein